MKLFFIAVIGFISGSCTQVKNKPVDSNAKPTGGMRQIQYKLVDGENMRS